MKYKRASSITSYWFVQKTSKCIIVGPMQFTKWVSKHKTLKCTTIHASTVCYKRHLFTVQRTSGKCAHCLVSYWLWHTCRALLFALQYQHHLTKQSLYHDLNTHSIQWRRFTELKDWATNNSIIWMYNKTAWFNDIKTAVCFNQQRWNRRSLTFGDP